MTDKIPPAPLCQRGKREALGDVYEQIMWTNRIWSDLFSRGGEGDEAMRDRMTAGSGQAYGSKHQEKGDGDAHQGKGSPRINDLTEAGPGA